MVTSRPTFLGCAVLIDRITPRLPVGPGADATSILVTLNEIRRCLTACENLSEADYQVVRIHLRPVAESLEELDAACEGKATAGQIRLLMKIDTDLAKGLAELESILSELSGRRYDSVEARRLAYATASVVELRASRRLTVAAVIVAVFAALAPSATVVVRQPLSNYQAAALVVFGAVLLVVSATCFLWATRSKRAASIYMERSIQAPALETYINSFEGEASQLLRASLSARLFPRSPYDDDVLQDPVPVSTYDLLALLRSQPRPHP